MSVNHFLIGLADYVKIQLLFRILQPKFKERVVSKEWKQTDKRDIFVETFELVESMTTSLTTVTVFLFIFLFYTSLRR